MRILRVKNFVNGETFCFAYGDTLANVNILELVSFHKKTKTIATVTACQPSGRFGVLKIANNKVEEFKEKIRGDSNWVNGGFFVLEPSVFEYIKYDSTIWEEEPVQNLVKEEQLSAFKHSGFYQPMDTISDKKYLETLWNTENAAWKIW